MKPIEEAALTAWQTGSFQYDIQVLIDPDGFGIPSLDLSRVNTTTGIEINFVNNMSIGENQDQQVAELSLTLKRDVLRFSVNAFNEDSLLNTSFTPGGAYVPLIAPYRRIQVWARVGALGAENLDAAAWVPLFDGRIDTVDNASSAENVKVDCRDMGCDFQDEWIEAVTQYGASGGENLNITMQDIVTDWVTGDAYVLWNIDTPLFSIGSYAQSKQSVMDALRAIVDQIGYDLRWKWNGTTSNWQMAFYDPDRTKTVPDFTITPDQKISVDALSTTRTNVRNRIRVIYTDASTGEVTSTFVFDSVSIGKYGPKYMEMTEDSSSQIDTASEAIDMANAILSDLSEPEAEYTATLPFMPWVELTDLHNFKADGGNHTTDIQLAVVQFTHSLDPDGVFRTTVQYRGKPSAGFRKWLRMSADAGVGSTTDLTATAQPTGVTATQTPGGLWVQYDEPEDSNWSYSTIFVDTVSGFTPSVYNAKYKGRQNSFLVAGLTPGSTYYIKVIAYNTDGTSSTVSSQVAVAASLIGTSYMNLSSEQGTLLPNSDFNTWTLPDDLTTRPPDNWEIVDASYGGQAYPCATPRPEWWSSSGTAPSAYADTDGATGTYRLLLYCLYNNTSISDAAPGIRVKTPIPVTYDTVYEMDALVMREAPASLSTSAPQVTLEYLNINSGSVISHSIIAASSGSLNPAEQWKKLRYRFKTPNDDTITGLRLSIWFYSAVSGSAPYTYAVDFFKLRRADCAFERNTYNTSVSGTTLTSSKALTFTTEAFDYSDSCTAGTSTTGDYFTAPEDGTFELEALAGFITAGSGTAYLALQTSTDLSTWTDSRLGAQSAYTTGLSILLPVSAKMVLSKGTAVRVVLNKTESASSTILSTNTQGRFSGKRVDTL